MIPIRGVIEPAIQDTFPQFQRRYTNPVGSANPTTVCHCQKRCLGG
ncbi:MAG: hypothetical protein AAFV72_17030 [Cyanobacteria bacterium J06635_1]